MLLQVEKTTERGSDAKENCSETVETQRRESQDLFAHDSEDIFANSDDDSMFLTPNPSCRGGSRSSGTRTPRILPLSTSCSNRSGDRNPSPYQPPRENHSGDEVPKHPSPKPVIESPKLSSPKTPRAGRCLSSQNDELDQRCG